MTTGTDHSTLYSTIAQVLPLFVLALVAERRIGVTERSRDAYVDAMLAIGFLASVAIGEVAAFRGLAGNDSHRNLLAAESAIAFAGLLLYVDIVLDQVSRYLKAPQATGWRRAVVIAAGLIAALYATVVLLLWSVGITWL